MHVVLVKLVGAVSYYRRLVSRSAAVTVDSGRGVEALVFIFILF